MDIAQQTDRIERLQECMQIHRAHALQQFERQRSQARAHAVDAIRERLEAFLALAQDRPGLLDLVEVARKVAEHFKDTDAPLGELARAALEKAEGRYPFKLDQMARDYVQAVLVLTRTL